jgi:hypothetical protein
VKSIYRFHNRVYVGNQFRFTDWWYLNSQGTPDPFPDYNFQPVETIRNGQLIRHTIDGVDVPGSYFAIMTEFAFGSIFGLVEQQARLSQGNYLGSLYSYRDRSGVRGFGTDRQGALQFQAETHGAITETRLWAVSDNSWAINLSLIFVSMQTKKLPPEKQKMLTDALNESKNRLKKKECYEALGFKSKKEVDKFFQKNKIFSYTDLPVESKTNPGLYTNTVASTNTDDGNINVNAYGDFYSDSSGFVEGPGKKKYQLIGGRTPYTKEYKDAIFSFASDGLYRVLILLHEISHSRGVAAYDGPTIPDYKDKQAENNDRVLKNCFESKTQGAGAGGGITSTVFK